MERRKNIVYLTKIIYTEKKLKTGEEWLNMIDELKYI